ncbi:TPA: prophage tail fiber N-terminal domain-containing protein [Salmonella enterica]|nr:prophage tail fiber N-terminal domain-containing protein [Salmonella enterica]
MPVLISGVLKDGTGKPIQNCTIQLKAKRTSTTVIVSTVASENPDEAGSYSMNVEPGQYSVTLQVEGFPPSVVGTITVYEDSQPGTLNDFLNATREDDLMPDALKQFGLMVKEAEGYAGQAREALKETREIVATPGPQGEKGEKGDTGPQGAPGLSAYETWAAEQPAGSDTSVNAFLAYLREGSSVIPKPGDVGSYVLARAQGGGGGFGAEVEGVWLMPAAYIDGDFWMTETSSLTGTWVAAGYFSDTGAQTTLFLRIR